MIHVVLDTNIYRSKPRLNSPEFKALSYLAKKGCICIHIPYVVEHEFLSFLFHEHEKKITEAIKAISMLIKKQKVTELVPELEKCLGQLKENKKELTIEPREDFLAWMTSVNVVRYGLSDTEAINALNAYFYGKAPLKQPKNRNDIPDSFIYQSIITLHNKHGNKLHFVVNDGNLRGACQSDGISIYASLDEFIAIDEAKDYLKNALIEDNKVLVTRHLLQYATDNKDLIMDQIESLMLNDEYRLINASNPGESNEIYVSGVYKPHAIDFSDKVEHYGEGLFVIHFNALVELTCEFAVYKSDVYDLDRTKYYVEYLNDHYYNVETTDEFSFSGRLELEFDEDFDVITESSELFDALKTPKISISELENFEIIA